MKKHILFSLAVIFMSVIGCTKPEEGGKDNPQPPAPSQEQITIPSTVDVTPVVPPEGGDAKITFTATAAWTASVVSTKADSWVDVNPKSGNPGPAEIKITTTPNDTYVERNATVQIKCGSKTKDIVLTQKQVDNITVTTDKVELSAEGGTFTIELKSNIDFSYEIEGDWIKYVSTKAYTDKTLTFSAEPNEGLQKREGSVTVKGGGFSETVKVYQSAEEPTFIISQKEYEVEAEGGTVEVSVTSNIGYHATSSVDWIHAVETKTIQTKSLWFVVDANTSTEPRSGVIVICNDNEVCIPVTVKQAGGKSTLSISPSSLEFGYDGGENQVAVTSNADWTAECTADWCFVSPSSESGDCTVKVMVNANREEQYRSATVTFKTKESSKTLTILQKPFETVFEVSPRTHTADAAGGTVTVTVTSNIGYHATSSVDWIQELGTKANQGGTHIFRIEENKSIQKRTGAIVFCNDENVCVPVEIEQEGAAATISVSSSIVEFSSSSGEKTVEITSNAEWTVSQKPQWCTLSPSSATGSTSVRVSVTENGNTVPREGKIVFSAGNAIAELSVQQQAGEPELEVGDTELSFSGSGGVASFSILSNADWVVNTGVLWLKASAEEGTGNATVTLTAERNEKTEARTAQVTVRTKDGIIRKSITVSQAAGEPYLELDVYSLNFSPQEGRAEVSVSSNASWNVTSSDSWCTVEKNTAANSVSVFVKANDSGKSRSAIITVKADKGGLEKTVTVSQSTPEDNEGFDDDGEIIWD